MRKIAAVTLLFFSSFCFAESCSNTLVRQNAFLQELSRYESIRVLGLAPVEDMARFRQEHGIVVTKRDALGNAVEGRIRVLSDNPFNEIYVLSGANGWGVNLTAQDRLSAVSGTPYFEGTVRGLTHAMEYRLRVNGNSLLDPGSDTFSTHAFLNSIFWDFDRPGAYQMRVPSVDLRGKFPLVAESGVAELVQLWESKGGVGPARQKDTYRYIAESGVIGELKEMGYNAIEFLPYSASVDGDEWSYRYQVYGLFGPDSRYGDPDDFARMVDAFNQAGFAVLMDAVVGHYPYHGNQGSRDLGPIGLHNWKKADGQNLYGRIPSPWGTHRYDYANPFVRRFLVDGCLNNMRRYGISGIRVDNLDGIRFYEGPGGGGETFLRELATGIRKYRPEALLIGEMFFGHNPVMESLDRGGLGFNLRTHSHLFDFFKDNLLKQTWEVNMWTLRSAIRLPWEWGEAPRIQYPTNHDEAASHRDGATGAYIASLVKGGGWYYVENKTKAFASLSMLSGSAYLDMPQMRLLQEGTFGKNPAVEWGLRKLKSQGNVNRYFSHLSKTVTARAAFAFQNFHPNIENHSDHGNKVISLLRIDFSTGKKIVAVINLSHQGFPNYSFGLDGEGTYRVIVDSDRAEFGGTHTLANSLGAGVIATGKTGKDGKRYSMSIPYLAPYATVVLEESE